MTHFKILSSLVLFFLASGIFAQIEITWKQEKAIAVTFFHFTKDSQLDLNIHLADSERAIYGTWQSTDSSLTFQPVIAFTQNKHYELRNTDNLLLDFTIEGKAKHETKILNIYPDCDTVPANLLKVHLRFSHPMGEQLSEEFVCVTGEKGDTLKKIFLPLQPELWNEAHDQLTLWLDPGRIKRDLGPNVWLGAPLEENNQYTIDISPAWKDYAGQLLIEAYHKIMFVQKPDRTRPNPAQWSILAPKEGSKGPLQVHFHESMDYVLARECLTVLLDKQVSGNVSLEKYQQIWTFTPDFNWIKGKYKIRIESRLEDLAGNNLNRLFDENLDDRSNKKAPQELYYLTFVIP